MDVSLSTGGNSGEFFRSSFFENLLEDGIGGEEDPGVCLRLDMDLGGSYRVKLGDFS